MKIVLLVIRILFYFSSQHSEHLQTRQMLCGESGDITRHHHGDLGWGKEMNNGEEKQPEKDQKEGIRTSCIESTTFRTKNNRESVQGSGS